MFQRPSSRLGGEGACRLDDTNFQSKPDDCTRKQRCSIYLISMLQMNRRPFQLLRTHIHTMPLKAQGKLAVFFSFVSSINSNTKASLVILLKPSKSFQSTYLADALVTNHQGHPLLLHSCSNMMKIIHICSRRFAKD